MNIVNIAGYKFVPIAQPEAFRAPLRERCLALGLKGTVLLAPEGINLFLAGPEEGIGAIQAFLREAPLFAGAFTDLRVKASLSVEQPFRRMLVRIKKEIITMRRPAVLPQAGRAPAVSPRTLRRWLDQGTDDEGRALLLLDTRNRFEVELGTFEGAHQLGIAHFGEFPDAFAKAQAQGELDLTDKHVVTFCTGGIRCEKAALYMSSLAPCRVTQLEGGILQYFEDVGGSHWQGECFVFDDRVALDSQLRETATVQCYACRSVVDRVAQEDRRYVPGVSCPLCAAPPQARLQSS
jgi:UPF0176 protein